MRLGFFSILLSGTMYVLFPEFLKLSLPGSKLLVRSKPPNSRPQGAIGGDSLVDPLLNPAILGVRSCGLSVGDVQLSFHGNNLNALTEAMNILKGIDGHGVAKMVFESWEIGSAPFITVRWREIQQQPQLNGFRAVSQEKRVDFVEEVTDPRHIEPLRDPNGIDVLGKGAMAFMERTPSGLVIIVVVCLESSSARKVRMGRRHWFFTQV